MNQAFANVSLPVAAAPQQNKTRLEVSFNTNANMRQNKNKTDNIKYLIDDYETHLYTHFPTCKPDAILTRQKKKSVLCC